MGHSSEAKRLGTLLNDAGQPKHLVEIIRLGPKQARVREVFPDAADDEAPEIKVPRALILEDGGHAWERYGNSSLATLLDSYGEPAATVKVIRSHKHVSFVQMFEGTNLYPESDGWGPQQEALTNQLRWDAGESWGKRPSKINNATAERVTPPPPPSAPSEGDRKGEIVAYMRVSSEDQSVDRQIEEIKRAVGPVNQSFSDKISAVGHLPRPGLEACLNYLRPGDTLVVSGIDRMARSVVDMRKILDIVIQKGATLHFISENLTLGENQDASIVFQLNMLSAVAELERSIIRSRQKYGIELAKARGVYKGRQRALSPAEVDLVRELRTRGEPVKRLAQKMQVHPATIYRALKDDYR